jgi:O-antigen ligase
VKTELKSAGLQFAAAAVLLVGGIAWLFPRVVMATAGEWPLPALSLTALVLAIVMASPWAFLRALLVVLGVALVVSWHRASLPSTSHCAGAALGCLAMVTVGSWAQTPRRLRAAMLAFLCGGLVIQLLGLGGTDLPQVVKEALRSTMSVFPPSMPLGLDGLDVHGTVNSNAVASAVLLVLPVAIVVVVFGRRQRIDWWTLLPAGIVVIVVGTGTLAVTLSRTAFVSVWLMAVGLLVHGMRSRLHRVIAGVIIVAPLLILPVRLASVTQEAAAWDAHLGWVSARGRSQIMGQALDRWKQSPWFGIGVNEFRNVYTPRPGDLAQEKDIAHAHNMVLQTALDVGIVGSVAYWGILASLWVRASQAAKGTSKTARAAAVGGAFSLIGVTLFGLADAVTLGAKVGTLQWIAGGLILAAWSIRVDQNDPADDVNADSRKP